MTRLKNGTLRFISDPPLVVPVSDMQLENYLDRPDLKNFTKHKIKKTWRNYLASLPDERRYLLASYEVTDIAMRVGGIGSVGTRCAIVLLRGEAEHDALILQFKEAGPSVLEAYSTRQNLYLSNAQRVVTAQRLMEATSDIFLGWGRGGHTKLDYYWRQLKDMKGSADISSMDAGGLKTYLSVCSWCLARAHARTGDALKIRGYMGKADAFTRAIGAFALAYADQAERDHQVLVKALKSGRISAETGV